MQNQFSDRGQAMAKRTVVVFGGGGYVGAVLTPMLLAEGYTVRVFDTFWYGKTVFTAEALNPNLELIAGDIRDLEAVASALKGATDVIHLACISNDPSFDLDPALGKSINLDSFTPLVKIAKQSGVHRFIYASSSSVYGVKVEEKVTEELSLEPLTDYSKFKANCEEIILAAHTSDFRCTVLRPATVCGVSSRQRFDLSVNILTNHAVNLKKITVFGGSQFRPNLHIQDMARAYLHVLAQDKKIDGAIFNVGGENLSLDQIALKVQKQIDLKLEIHHSDTDDLRSYRVDSSKILDELGFKPIYSVDQAIADLQEAFVKDKYNNSLENSMYFNIKRMKELSLA
jgi:nucleoside-diphosphate-sugar epimerase